jgi:hypothetical protein
MRAENPISRRRVKITLNHIAQSIIREGDSDTAKLLAQPLNAKSQLVDGLPAFAQKMGVGYSRSPDQERTSDIGFCAR